MYLCICARLIILCIRSIGRGIGGASPSPVIFWIGWKTNGVCCCLSTLGPWGLAGEMVECREMASQADADYRAGGIP